MIRTLATNENNDIFLDKFGNIAILEGLEAVQQICLNAARARRGEMIYAVNRGMPFFETIWSGSPNLQQFKAALRRVLLNVTGVTGITSLDAVIVNQTVQYSVTITTIYGDGAVNGIL